MPYYTYTSIRYFLKNDFWEKTSSLTWKCQPRCGHREKHQYDHSQICTSSAEKRPPWVLSALFSTQTCPVHAMLTHFKSASLHWECYLLLLSHAASPNDGKPCKQPILQKAWFLASVKPEQLSTWEPRRVQATYWFCNQGVNRIEVLP